MSEYIFTSESVTEGHPDKVCDLISDAVLDAYLAEDPAARVACEISVKNNTVILLGEISGAANVDIEQVVRNTVRHIGYDRNELGFNADTADIIFRLDAQSPDIAAGVDRALESRNTSVTEIGAGDQGMVFGFAVNETKELMPLPISLAHRLSKRLTEVRKNQILPYLRPDGKTQVSVRYQDDVPVSVDVVLVSAQHEPDVVQDTIRKDIIEHVVRPVVPAELLREDTLILINPTGRFVIGGPAGDSGLTGRKIIVDTYGGYSRHGGGAFSGKDPTKVDRSAAYAARYVAKNIVAAKLARKCEVQLAYAIGVAAPVSVYVNTFGTGEVSEQELVDAIKSIFDLRPGGIIESLSLRRPIYKSLAAYGHIGREDLDVRWESRDATDKLLAYFGRKELQA
ncbi:MAG TPA: methionine adenosyltransferase [Ruminococcaceae bacterium]|nr:methionine adenosyltransferase [Oscillospiraceae bacterium]